MKRRYFSSAKRKARQVKSFVSRITGKPIRDISLNSRLSDLNLDDLDILEVLLDAEESDERLSGPKNIKRIREEIRKISPGDKGKLEECLYGFSETYMTDLSPEYFYNGPVGVKPKWFRSVKDFLRYSLNPEKYVAQRRGVVEHILYRISPKLYIEFEKRRGYS